MLSHVEIWTSAYILSQGEGLSVCNKEVIRYYL